MALGSAAVERALDLAQAVRRVARSPWGPQKEQEAFIYVLLCLYTNTGVASMVQRLPERLQCDAYSDVSPC